jgi:hypothetical protein
MYKRASGHSRRFDRPTTSFPLLETDIARPVAMSQRWGDWRRLVRPEMQTNFAVQRALLRCSDNLSV